MTAIIPDLLSIQPENLRAKSGASRASWELQLVAVPFRGV